MTQKNESICFTISSVTKRNVCVDTLHLSLPDCSIEGQAVTEPTKPDSNKPVPEVPPILWRRRLGIAMIVLSGVLWFSLFAVPFLPLSLGNRTALAGALFVGVQIAWWGGAALVGPALARKIKAMFKRRTKKLSPRPASQQLTKQSL